MTTHRLPLTGRRLLAERYLNKGTAFTSEERAQHGLNGLLPPVVETLGTQLKRVRLAYDAKSNDIERHVYLRALQERNSVLFYAFLSQDIERLLPIVYTPTVGLACQKWSNIYRREHGLYLSWPQRNDVEQMLNNAIGDRSVDVVVATDGERILGLGDLGIGGMGIPIGKLALYTAAGGLDPARTLPVVLDVGTDNEALLSDPLYLGWRHPRVRGEQYDELVDAFIQALRSRLPNVLLQWEDFAQSHANRLLHRHRDSICSFNDDIQGTAAVTVAAIVAGMAATDEPLRDLRLVIAGAGSAGTGIAAQAVRALVSCGLSEHDAHQRCWLVDRYGLLHERMEGLLSFQKPFARSWQQAQEFAAQSDGTITLRQVVAKVAPHALVGVTGQPGLFTEAVLKDMARGIPRPIVLPLSNPTPRAEAIPADILKWTKGRALVGTGSPFDPVTIGTTKHHIAQVNNVYVFPGIGLGVVACEATAVSDRMLTAAARAVGELAPTPTDSAPARLLPPITDSRRVAQHVAFAVAHAAMAEGLAAAQDDAQLSERISQTMWQPEYAS